MSNSKLTFVYTTYIRTTPDKLWAALTGPEFMKQYWFGMHIASDFQAGAPWRLLSDEHRTMDDGAVVEADPPRKLVLRWRNRWNPELEAEGDTLCTMTLQPEGDTVRLQVVHESEHPSSRLIEAVSGGWPKILSNLKSLLETGAVILPAR
jgi:uncharacterized protein YndB with AHSA1/START domain